MSTWEPLSAESIRIAVSGLTSAPEGASLIAQGAQLPVLPRHAFVSDGRLYWTASISREGWSESLPTASAMGALHHFSRLWKEPAEEIAEFALRFGALYISDAGEPDSDLKLITDSDSDVIERMCGWSKPYSPHWYSDSIAHWQSWSAVICVLRTIGVALRDRDENLDLKKVASSLGLTDDLHANLQEFFYGHSLGQGRRHALAMDNLWSYVSHLWRGVRVPEQRLVLAMAMNKLLEIEPLMIKLTNRGSLEPKLELTSHTSAGEARSFPSIVKQLLNSITNPIDGFASCPKCTEVYEVKRRRGYCQICRIERRQERQREGYAAKKRLGQL